jgi:hypothetical protein
MVLERGSLSLMSTIKELFEKKKVAASGKKTEITAVRVRHGDHLASPSRNSYH